MSRDPQALAGRYKSRDLKSLRQSLIIFAMLSDVKHH